MHGIFDCGVCVWLIGKTSSQNSRETILLQLESSQLSSWMVEKLNCSFARFTKMIFVFQEYLRINFKNSTRLKKGEIFKIILRIFLTYYQSKRTMPRFFWICFSFYSLWRAQSYGWWIILQKKKKRNIWNTRLLDLKLRLKIVLQNYLIFAHRVFSGPRSNPGLEEVFLLILSLSLTNSCYRDCTNWTPGTC